MNNSPIFCSLTIDQVASKIGVSKENVALVAMRKPLRSYERSQQKILIAKCLQELATAYGIENIRHEAIIQSHKLILENFAMLDTEEIKLAFRLCAAGAIAVDSTFYYRIYDTNVIGKVLRAYIEYRKQIVRELAQQAKIDKEKQAIAYKNSPEFKEKADADIWQHLLREAQKTNLSTENIPIYFYDWLVGKELIAPTDDEKWEAIAAAIQAYPCSHLITKQKISSTQIIFAQKILIQKYITTLQ